MLSTRARAAPPTFARVSSRSRRARVPAASPRAELEFGARDIASPPRVAAVARPSPARGERRRRRRDASPQRASRDVKARGVPVLSVASARRLGVFSHSGHASMVYVFVAIRMYLGYDRTTFGSGVPKIAMCGLWPVLAALSASFRENLKRSL